jgi:hypothetical protein
MPKQGVVKRDRRNHSNLRPKHKHTRQYLKHYWPYLPMVTLLLVGLWLIKPVFFKASPKAVLAVATNVSPSELLDATNKERASDSKSALRLNTQLSSAAQAKAQDMASRNYWSHNTPDGSPPWTFIIDHGYQYQKAGENLAYGFTNSSDIVAGWMNSPTHRANVLDNDFVDVGFGTATSSNFNNSGPSTIIVAMYGRSVNEKPVLSVITPGTAEGQQTYNTSQKVNSAQAQSISKLDLLTGTRYTWITPVASFVMGGALMLLVIKHSLGIKKAMRSGEKFVVTHPVLDVVLVSIILGSLFITQQVGFIL